MKTLNIVIAGLLLLFNLVCGLIIPQYELFNIAATSFVIILNSALILVASNILNDAFKISLSFIFSLLGIIEIVLAILSPQEIVSNYYVVGIVLLIIFEVIILACAKLCQR